MVILETLLAAAVGGGSSAAATYVCFRGRQPKNAALKGEHETLPRGEDSEEVARPQVFAMNAPLDQKRIADQRHTLPASALLTVALVLTLAHGASSVLDLNAPYRFLQDFSHAEFTSGLCLAVFVGLLLFLRCCHDERNFSWQNMAINVSAHALVAYILLIVAESFGLVALRRCCAAIMILAIAASHKNSAQEGAMSPRSHESFLVEAGIDRLDDCSHRALADAIDSGRLVTALKELTSLETSGIDPRTILSERHVERVRRIGTLYEDSLELLKIKPSDYTVHVKCSERASGLEWGAKLENGKLCMTCIVEYDLDLLRALAVHQESTLESQFNADIVSHQAIGPQWTWESLWHKVTHVKSTGTKADDVFYKSTINALDEPLRAVWFAEYTPLEGSKTLPLPQTRPGHFRTPHLRNFITLAIVVNSSGQQRVRQTQFLEIAIKPETYRVMRMAPRWVNKKVLGKVREAKTQEFIKYCRDSQELEIQMRESARAPLYRELRSCLGNSG